MIIRDEHQSRYTVIANPALEDRRLSFRARGVLSYLLTKPDDWRVNSAVVASDGPEGRDAVRSAMAELERFGYVKHRRIRDDLGRIKTVVVVVESPGTAFQASVDQAPADQASVHQASNQVLKPSTQTKNPIRAKREQGGGGVKVINLGDAKGKSNLVLAAYFDTALQRARETHDVVVTDEALVDRKVTASAIGKMRAKYSLTADDVERMIDRYVTLPPLWKGRTRIWDFVSEATVSRLRNNPQVDDVEDDDPGEWTPRTRPVVGGK